MRWLITRLLLVSILAFFYLFVPIGKIWASCVDGGGGAPGDYQTCGTCANTYQGENSYEKLTYNVHDGSDPLCLASRIVCTTEAEAQCSGGNAGCPAGCYPETTFGCSNTEEGCNQTANCDNYAQCPPNPWSQKVFCCKDTKCVCPGLLCKKFPQLPECQTPTPTVSPTPGAAGTIQARAMVVPGSTTTCAGVASSSAYLAETLTLSPGVTPASQAVSGGSYATWSDIPSGVTYTLSDAPPADYVLKLACWSSINPSAQGTSLSLDLTSGSTVTWSLGYTDGAPWFKTQGGDVYTVGSLRSYIPAGTSPRYMSTSGLGGSPGIVTYGTSYDFDSSPTLTGESYISSAGWLVNDTDTSLDYYAIMYHRYGSPAPTSTGDTTYTSKPASGTYYVDGTLTIDSSDWTITNGEKLVVFVSGDLVIKRKIRINAGGFGAFVVKGTIAVDPTVGGLATSSTPALEGVFITSPTGSFISGLSTSVGTERLVVEGTVIAGDVELQRDLESVGVNNTTAAELFLYNPELLVFMPDQMKDVPVTWQEVAP